MAEGDAPVAKILRGLPANAGTLPLTPPGDGTEDGGSPDLGAVLDEEHVGDIEGAFGTIAYGDTGLRRSWKAKALTLLAIVGPGLIVMVGDNDAGGVAPTRKPARISVLTFCGCFSSSSRCCTWPRRWCCASVR